MLTLEELKMSEKRDLISSQRWSRSEADVLR